VAAKDQGILVCKTPVPQGKAAYSVKQGWPTSRWRSTGRVSVGRSRL